MNYLVIGLVILCAIQGIFLFFYMTKKEVTQEQLEEEIKVKDIKTEKEIIKKAIIGNKDDKKKPVNPFDILGGGV